MKKDSLSDIITDMLPVAGFILFFSSFIWILTGDTQDKWFSRFALGVICFGFYALIKKISNEKS